MILTDEDIESISLSAVSVKDAKADARAVEAAVLAKLTNTEMPEPQKYPAECFMREVNVCDALAVYFAIKEAYAQGAASQLCKK